MVELTPGLNSDKTPRCPPQERGQQRLQFGVAKLAMQSFCFRGLIGCYSPRSKQQQNDSEGGVDEFVISGCIRGQESKSSYAHHS